MIIGILLIPLRTKENQVFRPVLFRTRMTEKSPVRKNRTFFNDIRFRWSRVIYLRYDIHLRWMIYASHMKERILYHICDSKYIIRQSRISYRVSDISFHHPNPKCSFKISEILFSVQFSSICTSSFPLKILKSLSFMALRPSGVFIATILVLLKGESGCITQ